MEFILGITDVDPRKWQRMEPNWEDEQIQATTSDTFLQMLECLSSSALANRREYGDYNLHNHLWNLKISTLDDFCQRDREDREDRWFDEEHDEDDSNDESEKGYRGCFRVSPKIERQGIEDEDLEDYQIVEPEELLTTAMLQQDHVLHFEYDYGSTTDLYLKVLQVRSKVKGAVLRYIKPLVEAAKGSVGRQKAALETLPAYTLAKEHQIDALYPNFSKACMSKHVGQMTWGLSSRVSSSDDTTWCSMETPSHDSDLFFSCQPFENLEEFLSLAEEAWSPNPAIESEFRRDWISRFVYPADASADASYNSMLDYSKSEAAQLGPKILMFRRKPDDKIPHKFDFANIFPNTHAHFTSGKFRWFQYHKGALRVLVGRGYGHDNRAFQKDQVLETWLPNHFKFSSLHELLCAVEVSWSYNAVPLSPDQDLSPWDDDYLSPSRPLPAKPKILAKEEDAVVIQSTYDTKKTVVVLEITADSNRKMVLYSGHVDGTLSKWCLENNSRIWEKQVFEDRSDEFDHCNRHIGVTLQATGGVAGMVIRSAKGSCRTDDELYVWTNVGDFESPSKIICLLGSNAEVSCVFHCCVVGEEEGGIEMYPSVATLVLAPLCVKDEWIDSMVVGLHGTPETEVQEGNIIPFRLSKKKKKEKQQLKTWRGHTGIIKAMAVMRDIECLLSYTMQFGTGFPDAMILWDLKNPGVPLHRLMFWDPKASLFDQVKYRLLEVTGISVSGGDILLADQYGDRVVAVRVESKGQRAFSVEIVGYAKIGRWPGVHASCFHGTTAMCDGKFVVSNESSSECWLFDITRTVSDSRLDTREGNPRDFDEEDDDDDDEAFSNRAMGRQISVGKVQFPEFGGNKPRRKRRRLGSFGNSTAIDEDEPIPDDNRIWCLDTEDGQGNGGATAHAIFGRWLVSGFLNGSILRVKLPESFGSEVPMETSSGLVSCSRLPSDEWGCPMLFES